jgi:phage baseplate assembly protein W
MAIYTDLNLDFKIHPNTKRLLLSKDDLAIQRSVAYLLLTNKGDRLFEPDIGCDLKSLLFEPATISTAYDIESVINETITNFEPRVRIVSVSADPAIDRNSYEISIKFRVINRSTVRSLEFTLERLR